MAAVTFSGFNDIDFNQVVSAIIAQERQPLTRLETQQSALDTQKTAFGTLATKLTAVQSAIAGLADDSAVASLTASSSDAGVGAASTGGSIEGRSSKEQVNKLVTAYNDLVSFINDQRTASTTGKTSIARDPLVQQLKNSLRTALLGPYTNEGEYSRLAEVGLGFDKSGKMILDEDTFDEALSSGVEDVQALFAGDDGDSGAFGAIGDLIKGYTQSGGLVADVRERLSTQMQSLATRIDMFEAQLERRRLTLRKEFQAADEAMSRMNAQVASLSALGNQYRLF